LSSLGPVEFFTVLALTEIRKNSDQIVDGIITAGVWILALSLPLEIYPPKGDVIVGSPVLGIPLAIIFFGYIIRNFRMATTGDSIQVSDLIAKVIVPVTIFSVLTWAYFS